jgi:hypothetical protein
VLVYSTVNTPRFLFALDLLFKHVLKLNVELTTNLQEAQDYSRAKLAYGFKPVQDIPTVIAHGLLHEKEIEQFNVQVQIQDNGIALFPNKDEVLGFDVFSAAFYLVTRYEEYLPHKKDKHGRFAADQSLAFAHGFLDKPVVNIWGNKLFEFLKNSDSTLKDNRQYNFIPTIDVDSAFLYAQKGFVRTTGAYARSLLKFDVSGIKKRTETLLSRVKDPLDVFDKLIELQQKHQLNFVYFFLVADYGLNDKNVPVYSRKFQALIKHVADYATVGLHPSYASNSQHEQLRIEASRLNEITHRPTIHSRQHFLIFELPSTYRRLLEVGVTHDYSMGYPDMPGFRASIANPFPFYDLELDKVTHLVVHPFSLMEATYKYYLPENKSDLMAELQRQVELLKTLKAEFCPLWHNDSLSEINEWKDWSPLFDELIETAKP